MRNRKLGAFSVSVLVLVGALASTGLLFFVPAPALGNTATPTPTPEPTPTPTPEPTPTPTEETDDDGSSDGGGGGGSGGGGSTDDIPPEPMIDRTATDDSVTVAVENAGAETDVSIELGLSGPNVDDPAVTLDRLRFVTLGELSSFEVTVERPSELPGDVSSPPGVTAMWYVGMNSTVDNDDIDNVSVRFRLAEERLPDGTEPGDVQVVQFDDDGWTPVPTAYDNEVYDASADGFQSFAIVVPAAGSVTVVDAEVPTDRVRQGETTTARVTLQNAGETNVTETVTVAIDGDAVAMQEVELPPGETDVDIDFEVATGGVVTVNGFEAGEVRTGPPSETPPDDAPGDDSSGGLVWLLPLVLAVIAFGVGIWYIATELDTDQL